MTGIGGTGITTVGSTNARVRNNISFSNGTNTDFSGTGTVASNNLTSNPSFVDATKGNFALQAGSGAIGAGVTLSEVPYDFDGISRPQGSAYDIGAYEYH